MSISFGNRGAAARGPPAARGPVDGKASRRPDSHGSARRDPGGHCLVPRTLGRPSLRRARPCRPARTPCFPQASGSCASPLGSRPRWTRPCPASLGLRWLPRLLTVPAPGPRASCECGSPDLYCSPADSHRAAGMRRWDPPAPSLRPAPGCALSQCLWNCPMGPALGFRDIPFLFS